MWATIATMAGSALAENAKGNSDSGEASSIEKDTLDAQVKMLEVKERSKNREVRAKFRNQKVQSKIKARTRKKLIKELFSPEVLIGVVLVSLIFVIPKIVKG